MFTYLTAASAAHGIQRGKQVGNTDFNQESRITFIKYFEQFKSRRWLMFFLNWIPEMPVFWEDSIEQACLSTVSWLPCLSLIQVIDTSLIVVSCLTCPSPNIHLVLSRLMPSPPSLARGRAFSTASVDSYPVPSLHPCTFVSCIRLWK